MKRKTNSIAEEPKSNLWLFLYSWEQRKLGEITKVLSASRVHKEEWASDGVPFFRSSDVVSAFKGNNNDRVYISQELYEELIKSSGKLQQGDILITGGGSIGIPYIVPDNEPLYSKDADLIWIKKSTKHDSHYLYTYFISPKFRDYISGISHIGTIAHYTIEQVEDTPIPLPNMAEQEVIGSFFCIIDTLITLHQRNKTSTHLRHASTLEQNRNAWEQRKLVDLFDRVTRKNRNNESKLPLTISAMDGLVDQIVYFNNRVASKNISGYYLVYNGEFAYNKSTSDGYPWGAIKRLDLYEKGVLSTLYIVFSIKDSVGVDSDFMTTLFETDTWHNGVREHAAEGARNHGLLNISADDFFDVSVTVPKQEKEQEAIGVYFKHLDHLITLHQRKP